MLHLEWLLHFAPSGREPEKDWKFPSGGREPEKDWRFTAEAVGSTSLSVISFVGRGLIVVVRSSSFVRRLSIAFVRSSLIGRCHPDDQTDEKNEEISRAAEQSECVFFVSFF